MLTTTSGDGLIYNITRAKMLNGTFRWTDPDKWIVLANTDYIPNENHRTVADIAGTAAEQGYGGQVPGLFVSQNSWAGSAIIPVSTLGGITTKPLGGLVIVRIITPGVVAPTNYELVACLTTFIGGPIYPDGSPFSLAFDQSNGQQGWFRP